MNRILLNIFAAGLIFAVGHALSCYECPLGVGNVCLGRKEINCSVGETCYTDLTTAIGIPIKKKGCILTTQCNVSDSVAWPTASATVYKMTRSCCGTNLCNAAPGQARMSLLTLSLATLTTLFMAKALV